MLLCLSLAGLTALAVHRWGENILGIDAATNFTATTLVVDESAAGISQPIIGVAADPRQAAETAQSLARDYIAERMSQWRRESETSLGRARRAVERAREDYAAAIARQTALKRQLTLEAQAAARKAMDEAEQQRVPATIENPRLRELNARLREELQGLERLMVNRTRLHPSVQEAEERVEELKSRLAAEPPRLPNPRAENAAKSAGQVSEKIWKQVVERVAEENRARLEELSATAEQSRRACDGAEWRDWLAWQKTQSPPRLAARPAVVERSVSPANAKRRWLTWMTIAAGTIMGLGAMVFFRGAAIDPPLRSVAEAHATRGLVLLGTVPAETNRPSDAEISRRYLLRRMLIAAGLLLMLSCPAAALWCMLAA
jgi:hypothetical protein